MQGQRYWIERAFQDNIGELGLADYQVRKYNSWYHHMALAMMAMHFILMKRIEKRKRYHSYQQEMSDCRPLLYSYHKGSPWKIKYYKCSIGTNSKKKDIERRFKDNQIDNLFEDFPDNS